jgi:tetratricopeptide (TPR) repeat protein
LFSPAYGLNADSVFYAANKFYDAKDYAAAKESYLFLERNDYVSPALYFNLGNCYFKEGKLGYAVLYYLRAQRIDPTDEDIKNNLAFVRQFLPTNIEGVRINPVTTFFETITSPFTLSGLAWISSILFIALILFLCGIIYFNRGGTREKAIAYALLLFLLVFSGMTTYKYRVDYLTRKGVIVVKEANIYSGPGEDNDLEFVAAHGLTFEIEKDVDNYFLGIFENKRKGWIKKEYAEII